MKSSTSSERARSRTNFERRAGADHNCAKVTNPDDLDEMSDGAHQMVHAVLLVDDADIAENEFSPAMQPRLRLDATDAHAIGHPVDDLDLRGRFAATAYGDVFECRVGGDDAVGRQVAHALEKHQRSIEKPFLAKFNDKQLRRDVMLIVDETLAHELEWQSGEEDEVWRVASLDDRKTALAVNLEQESELMEQRC